MRGDSEEVCDRLSQAKLLKHFLRDVRLSDMMTVYWSERTEEHSYGIYCALVPSEKVESALDDPGWDLMHGSGLPGAIVRYDGAEQRVEYHRYGDDSGVEPLVIDRFFHGIFPDYRELREEFRLFHNLFHERKQDQYLKFDETGNEELIATVEPHRIQVRLKEVLQFLAIKDMYLALFFDCAEHSEKTLGELGLTQGSSQNRADLSCWSLGYGDYGGIGSLQAFSRLLGKRFFKPLPKEKSGFWGFAEEAKEYVDFIIGVNDQGDPITHTSNPDLLANFFGANPGAPNYLTPVHFRKQVLDKYYSQPGKFQVEDSTLRCGGLWLMTMDNHHNDRVVAWLGDLGRDLPYQEQLHWRSQNILPTGTVSRTFFKRQVMGEFTDSERPEHIFQEKYMELGEASQERLDWSVLLPLAPEDMYHTRCLRVPSRDEQKDFDELIQSLTKILIDSLNERALNCLLPADMVAEIKGSISRLEAVLKGRDAEGYESHVAFLRDLQDFRSSGVAHRKGSNYRKMTEKFHLRDESLSAVFSGMLGKGIEVLDFLITSVRNGTFDSRG